MGVPDSKTKSVADLYDERLIRLPKYQRDFAWDSKKMNQLWYDLMTHLVKYSQLADKKNHYFLGTIVLEDNIDGIRYLVDGQQRFTTLYLISTALRDALIATGHDELAHKIQHKLIINTHKIDDAEERNRYSLLDLPEGDPRSYEVRISPYRKRITHIRTGLITKQLDTLQDKGRQLWLKPGLKVKWTVAKNETWKFRLWDPVKKKLLPTKLTISDNEINNLRFGDNAPAYIELDDKSSSELFSNQQMVDIEGGQSKVYGGLEIILEPNVKWPNNLTPLEILDTSSEKKQLNIHGDCDLFHPAYREFYVRVRASIEHFIQGEKVFTPANGVKMNESSTTLQLKSESPVNQIKHSSRAPSKGEVLQFEERQGEANFPEDQELLELINSDDDEDEWLEFKQSFRKFYPHPSTGVPKQSKIMIEMAVKTVCSFLNSKGGLLIVGIQDKTRRVVGINKEGYTEEGTDKWSNEKAKRVFADSIRSYIGAAASKFVSYKVYDIHGNKVMCVKVEKWPNTKKPIEVKISTKWDKKTGERLSDAKKEAYYRDNESNLAAGKDLEEHISISHFLSNKLGGNYSNQLTEETKITHEFEIVNFQGIPDKDTTSILTSYPKAERKILSDNEIPSHAICRIPYLEPGKEWRPHLLETKQRAKEITELIQNICFTVVKFQNNPAAAITHFMLANDATRFAALSAYDLTSSFTEKLIHVSTGDVLTSNQEQIKKIWEGLRQNLYIDSNKKIDQINRFFEAFLLSTLRTKTSSARWPGPQVWEGLEKEFSKRTFDNGEYDYPEMEKFYSEMSSYMISYLRASSDESRFWLENPYNLSDYRDERTYLNIIYKTGVKQHISPFIALVKSVDKQGADRSVIRDFLKNFNYIWLRYQTIPTLRGTVKPFIPNNVYGRMLSSKDGWLRVIEKADLKDPEDIKKVSSLPLQLEKMYAKEYAEAEDKDLGELWPWESNHEIWPELNVGGTLSGTQIAHILYSVERALEMAPGTQQNPKMSRIRGTGKTVQVEHIVPINSRQLGGKWWSNGENTKHHKKYVYALGNHCLLEDTKNSEAGNKIPIEKVKSYRGSDFKLAKKIADDITKSGTWDVGEIERNSTRIMNALVEFYTPE